MNSHIILSHNDHETEHIAQFLAQHLKNKDIVGLIGDLGAGKTCFSRGIAEHIQTDLAYQVSSPTFTLVNIYPGPLSIYHFDLYRLENASELYNLGMDDYLNQEGIFLIEWANKFDQKVQRDIDVILEYHSENTRLIRFEAYSERGQDILKTMEF